MHYKHSTTKLNYLQTALMIQTPTMLLHPKIIVALKSHHKPEATSQNQKWIA